MTFVPSNHSVSLIQLFAKELVLKKASMLSAILQSTFAWGALQTLSMANSLQTVAKPIIIATQ
jgi:hypothetical protein